MDSNKKTINYVCEKYDLDMSNFCSAIDEFLKLPQTLKSDGSITKPNGTASEKKTREELKQDRVFMPSQRVKININYGTKQSPHYLVGEFVEDVDSENVKVRLLSTGRQRTVNKKSIVLTESTLFDKVLTKAFNGGKYKD